MQDWVCLPYNKHKVLTYLTLFNRYSVQIKVVKVTTLPLLSSPSLNLCFLIFKVDIAVK